MDEFTAKGALQTGLDLIRRRPMLILLWAALLLADTIGFVVGRQELMGWVREGIDAGRPSGSFSGFLLPYTLAAAMLSLVVTSMLWASAFRALMRPSVRVPLSFGLEELSVFATRLIIQLVAAVLSPPLQMFLFSRFNALDARAIVEVVMAALGVLGLFWSAVASGWAFAKLQVAPFHCWTVARGRFWLLACLVIGVAVVERLADAAIHQGVVALGRNPIFAPPLSTNPFQPAGARLATVFQLPALLQDATYAVIGALVIAFVSGIVTSAYRASLAQPQAASLPAGSVAAPN